MRARKGFSRLRHRSHSHSHSLPQQRKASPHTTHVRSRLRTPDTRAVERCQRQACGARTQEKLRSGPLRVVPRVFTRHAFHTLTTLALHRPRRSITSHALGPNCRTRHVPMIIMGHVRLVLMCHESCTRIVGCSRTCTHFMRSCPATTPVSQMYAHTLCSCPTTIRISKSSKCTC